MNKKILIISALDIWSMGKNKGAPSLWYTLKGYADNSWKVYFITGNKDKNSIYNVHENIKIFRFDIKWIKKITRLKKIGFFFDIIWWAYFQIKSLIIGYKIARKEKINIFYGYEIYGVPVAKILSKIFKKPIISRFQGITHLMFVYQKFLWKIRKWQDILAFKIPVDLLIMTNDGTQGDQMLRRLNINMDKVKFWINGVNKNIYIQNFDKEKIKRKLEIKKDEKILLSISRLVGCKRVDRIIKAMPEIIKKYPEVELLIIGDGQERDMLEGLAKDLRVRSHIQFLGALPHKELGKYYNLADIFISMYDISNVGNPLLEAMSCGKCIITLDVGDTNKFIHHQKNGILINPEQLNTLPNTIVNLLNNDSQRENLGENAKEYADKNFWTWSERIKQEIFVVNNLYNKNEFKK